MHSHQPDAVLICVDVTGLIELTVMQAGAQVGGHTGPSVAQVFPRRAETTLFTKLLPTAACLGPRQSTARSITDTPTRLVHLASRTLHLWIKSKHVTGNTVSHCSQLLTAFYRTFSEGKVTETSMCATVISNWRHRNCVWTYVELCRKQ